MSASAASESLVVKWEVSKKLLESCWERQIERRRAMMTQRGQGEKQMLFRTTQIRKSNPKKKTFFCNSSLPLHPISICQYTHWPSNNKIDCNVARKGYENGLIWSQWKGWRGREALPQTDRWRQRDGWMVVVLPSGCLCCWMPAAAAGSVCHSSVAGGPTNTPQTPPDGMKHNNRENKSLN